MMSAQDSDSLRLPAVACPFCGLLCDDLTIVAEADAVRVEDKGCPRSRALFAAQAGTASGPLLEGRPVALSAALARAAAILRESTQPLFLCAGADVAGTRALLELADRIGAVVDHANSDALLRNLLVLQDSGWVSTTLTEVRNRADLLVVAGGDVASRFPRFFERCFSQDEMLFGRPERELMFLGDLPADLPEPLKGRSTAIPVKSQDLAEVFGALRVLLAGKRLRAGAVAGVPLDQLANLLARMRAARYGVLTWAAADLDFSHAELAVQSMCELVQRLNLETRFSVLPLGGSDGDLTLTQVTTWQSGYPLRVSFASGAPEYDPVRFAYRRMLARREVNALLFVSAFDAQRMPPQTDVPAIVLARPGPIIPRAEVFIPVATPGMHHAAHLYRADSVVAIRLRKLVESSLPSAAQALAAIGKAVSP
jgi:formylmethanofuran dehydrogenase subunit B